MALNDLVKNPFKDMPKPARYTTVIGAGLIGGYFVYHHHSTTGSWNPWSSGSGTTSTGSPTTIDPVTGLAYSQDNVTDPITGQTYLAEADQYGSVTAAESSVSAYGLSTGGGTGIGINPASPPPAGSPNTVVGSTVYTSNSAWAQAATAGLADIGYSQTDVAGALADYLTATPVTTAQAALINTAIAEYGPAPSGNLQVILIPAAAPGNTTTTAKPSVSGGHTTSLESTRAVVAWTGQNATKYQVRIVGPGPLNGRTNTVTIPQASYEGLEAGHNYTVYITPYNASGTAGSTGDVTFKTT